MLKKLKAFIEKRREKRCYKMCYKVMDKIDKRTYTMKFVCAGFNLYNPEECCLQCPYFRDIRDNDDWA